MKTKIFVLLTIALPLALAAQGRQDRQDRLGRQVRQGRASADLSVDSDKVSSCGDLRITYDRRPAITEEVEMTLPGSQVSGLRMQLENSGIHVGGWDRSDYSVRTCKAVPDDDPTPTATLREITTTNTNGQITLTGPSDRQWVAHLIIMVPRLTALDLQTRNGPMSLHDFAGNIHVRATNGPISLNNVGGSVEAVTTNGPIALRNGSGDQRLTATNGPIAVSLSGSRWDGPGLEVSTQNGPLALSIPDGYASGVAVQTSARSPIACRASICADAARVAESPGMLRIGSGNPVVKLSSTRGPLAINSAKAQ